jgi:hypothetical protein
MPGEELSWSPLVAGGGLTDVSVCANEGVNFGLASPTMVAREVASSDLLESLIINSATALF